MWRSSTTHETWQVAGAAAISLILIVSVGCESVPDVTPSNSAGPSPSISVSPPTPSPGTTLTPTPAPTVTGTPTIEPTSTPTATPTPTPTPPPSLAPSPTPVSGESQLVMDINPHRASSNPTELTAVGDQVFFVADDAVHGAELWKTDGTAAGTVMVKDIRPGAQSSGPAWLTAVGNTLFFVANDGSKDKTQLWKSDGTVGGTVRVSNIVNYDYVGPYGLDVEVPPVAVGSQLFFFNTYCCVGGANLYVSDGTAAGTRRADNEDDYLTTPDADAAAYDGKLYFANYSPDSDLFGTVLWVSDGTVAGTHPLAGSPIVSEINILPASGQNLYFAAYNDVDYEVHIQLWKTDGTATGTQPLTSLGEVPSGAAYMSKRLYFVSDGLWKSDGTAAGTQPISDGGGDFLTAAGGHLYFARAGHLWISDGTPGGTADLVTFGGLWPRQIVAVGNETCFAVQNWDAKTWQLWESDGTLAGSYPVKSFVNPDTEAEGPLGAAVGGRFFFAADDGVHGAELWSYTP